MSRTWKTMMTRERFLQGVLVLMALTSQISAAATSILITIGLLCAIYDFAHHRERLRLDYHIGEIFLVYALALLIGQLMVFPIGQGGREAFGTLFDMMPFFLMMLYVKSWKMAGAVLAAFGCSVFLHDIASFFQMYHYLCARVPIGRLYGLTKHPSFLGTFLLLSLPLLAFLPRAAGLARRKRWMMYVIAASSFLVLLFSQSRGSWMGLAGVMLLLVVLGFRQKKAYWKVAGVFIALFLVLLLSVPSLQRRAETLADPNFVSNSERILMWKGAVEIWKDHPVFGIGVGNYKSYYNSPQYLSPMAKETLHPHPHNYFLKILCEQGTWGFVAFLLMHGMVAWQLYRCWRNPQGKQGQTAALCGLLAFAGFHLEGMTDCTLQILNIARSYWLVLGFCLAASQLKDDATGADGKTEHEKGFDEG